MYQFVKITNYYREFLSACYASNTKIAHASYEEQSAYLLGKRFGWSDYYSRNLRTLGVSASEIIANAIPLQRAWAEAHGFQGSLEEILFAQLADAKAEVVFLQDSIRFSGHWIDELRRRVPSVKLVIGWYCSPMSESQELSLKRCDFVMCCSPLFMEKLLEHGIRTYLLPHAFEPSILDEITNNSYPQVNFIFIGSILAGTGFHELRQQVLDRLIAADIGINLYGNIETLSTSDLFKRRLVYTIAHTLRSMGLEKFVQSFPYLKKGLLLNGYPKKLHDVDTLIQKTLPALYGLEMFKALAHARMAFNYHGDVAGEFAANIRLFETTGVGSCLITDWKKNLSNYFDLENEVVTFRSADECVEKVRWLSDHQAECALLAKRGQARTLRDHTYYNRALLLHDIILKHIR